MSLPALAPIPPANIRSTLETAEWEACLDAWLMLVDMQMEIRLDTATSVATFLHSHYHELAHLDSNDTTLRSSKAN